jgi:hypothetical protein
MQIRDLDHFQALDSREIKGGASNELLSFSVVDGILTLKLGETVLFDQKTGLAKQLMLSSKDTNFLMSSVTTQTINGVTKATYDLVGSPSVMPWKIFRLRYSEQPTTPVNA